MVIGEAGSVVHSQMMPYSKYSFWVVQGLLLASAQNTEYKAPSCFMSHAIDTLTEFLLMNVNFENSWAPHSAFEPRTFSVAGRNSTTRPQI